MQEGRLDELVVSAREVARIRHLDQGDLSGLGDADARPNERRLVGRPVKDPPAAEACAQPLGDAVVAAVLNVFTNVHEPIIALHLVSQSTCHQWAHLPLGFSLTHRR